MAELRWILLIAGLVFLAALAAWEKRKPRQARRDGGAQAPSRAEPTLAAGSQVPSEVHDAHAMHAAHAADTAYPAPASAAALSARAVPPVEIKAMPRPASAAAKAAIPLLSLTETSARRIFGAEAFIGRV